jgi:hypothetical protein
MLAISDLDLLTVWEAAQGAHPIARPAELLRVAAGEADPERLPVGARDRRLLLLREQWFGSHYESIADCPDCGVRVELTFETPPVGDVLDSLMRLNYGAIEIDYRLPDTRDLLSLVDCRSLAEGRARLAERCIVAARRDGDVLDHVPEDVIEPLAAALSAMDPDGDLRVALVCPDCGREWEAVFDPATHLWSDIESAAFRVLRDVDALATAYGWTEREILSLSPRRRQTYLRMVTS